jgi:two-component system chemotaxis response regulator CheB
MAAERVPWKLVALGGSAGGIPALFTILSALPVSFPVPIVVIQHLSTDFESRLPQVLQWRTKLRCRWAEHGECPKAGTVYVAPPGRNLQIGSDERFSVLEGRKPRLGWPSVDIFFESMAEKIGKYAIGVVLSGALSDGSRGIQSVRRYGGATMSQSIGSAHHPDMPLAAVDVGHADLKLTPARIAYALQILAERGVE